VHLDTDVAIIGGGVAGNSIARELSRYKIDTILIEKNAEVDFGVTKSTHSFIHAGLPEPGTPLLNKLVLEGNAMFDLLTSELDVPFMRIGKLLVVTNKNEVGILEKKKDEADAAGVPGVRIINSKELREMEPNLTREAVAALFTPTTGLVSPWELVIALSENAMENKVEFMLDAKVTGISVPRDNIFVIETTRGAVTSKFLINAAGLFADDIAKMVGENNFSMVPLKQERSILDERITNLVNHLVRSPITGDFVSPTKKELGAKKSNFIIGYTSEKIEDKNDVSTSREGFQRTFNFAKRMFPTFSPKDVIISFAGLVPLNTRTNDYIIEASKKVPGFINVVLGGSGVGASPAMAKLVVKILANCGLGLVPKKEFNPCRKGIPNFRELQNDQKEALIARDPRYAHTVCRCETVTEGEIVEAIRRGARTVDGIKFRTKAGMGRCQGGFCSPRVTQILARELGVPATEITKRGGNSRLLLFKSKEKLKNRGEGENQNEISRG